MPAISPSGLYMGTKHLVKSVDGHITYLVALFDQEDASLAYLIDGLYLTATRTAATSAAALSLLSPMDAPVDLAVLGSGLEASTHVEAIAHVRTVRSLAVYSPSEEKRQAFGRRFSQELEIAVRVAGSAESAVAGATHVVAAARAQGEQPILFASWIAKGSVVISIGSTLPTQRELDVSVIERAAVIVADEPEELATETGDMLEATARGIAFDSKLFSLRALARGALSGLLSESRELVLFKSMGSGLQDIAFAEFVADRCTQAGVGVELPVELAVKS